MNLSCKNCSERYPACQDYCESYKADKEKREALKEAIRKAKFEQEIAVEHFIRAGKSGKKIEKKRRGY